MIDYTTTSTPDFEETFLSSASTAYQTPNSSDARRDAKSKKKLDPELGRKNLLSDALSEYQSPCMIEVPLTEKI